MKMISCTHISRSCFLFLVGHTLKIICNTSFNGTECQCYNISAPRRNFLIYSGRGRSNLLILCWFSNVIDLHDTTHISYLVWFQQILVCIRIHWRMFCSCQFHFFCFQGPHLNSRNGKSSHCGAMAGFGLLPLTHPYSTRPIAQGPKNGRVCIFNSPHSQCLRTSPSSHSRLAGMFTHGAFSKTGDTRPAPTWEQASRVSPNPEATPSPLSDRYSWVTKALMAGTGPSSALFWHTLP